MSAPQSTDNYAICVQCSRPFAQQSDTRQPRRAVFCSRACSGHFTKSLASLADAFRHNCGPVEPSGCVPWVGTLSRAEGYGCICYRGCQYQAHRLAWVLAVGPIPDDPDICVCHRCDNRVCVNFAHLFLGSRWDNNEDKARKFRAGKVLIEEDVQSIRGMHAIWGYSQSRIARIYGVAVMTINRIISGEAWRFVG